MSNRKLASLLLFGPLLGVCVWMYVHATPAMSRAVTDPQFRSAWASYELAHYGLFWIVLVSAATFCVGYLTSVFVRGGGQ